MKILSLNVNGGGSRWSDMLTFVDTHSPDIVVFTEWRMGRASVVVESWASAHGMTGAQANEGATKNGVFVAAKLAFSVTSATPNQSCAGTLTLVRFADWAMLACYFPQSDKLAKARYFDVCQRSARIFLISHS
jgi:exonuclease III